MYPEANIESRLWADQHSFHWPDNKKNDDLKDKYIRLLNHLDMVKNNCRILAFNLIDEDQYEIAHHLIVEGQIHDFSKLSGVEWEYLCDFDKHKDSPELKEAVMEHVYNNRHHPEYWGYTGGIHSMPDEEVAVLVCDWVARGQEFGRGVRRFMEESAFEKYGFNQDSPVFGRISYFYKLLTGAELWSVLK